MTIVPPGVRRSGPATRPRSRSGCWSGSSRRRAGPGDLVLDPYAGSGTTGVAAARLGRRWLLVDRNPVAVAIARAPARGASPAAPSRDPGDHASTSATRWSRSRRRACARWSRRPATRDRGRGWARSTRTRSSAPGPRSASASSARRCRSSARSTSAQRAGPDPRPAAGHAAAAAPTSAGTTRPRPALLDARTRSRGSSTCTRGRSSTSPAAVAGRRARSSPRWPPRYRLAILSNWPLAATIDRYAEAAGLVAVPRARSSSRSGSATIKPHPAIFAAARDALGRPAPGVDPPRRATTGRRTSSAPSAAGWRAAYVPVAARATRRSPACERDDERRADLELDALGDLEAALDAAWRARARRRPPGGRAPSVDSAAWRRRDRIANLGAAGRRRGRLDPRRRSSSRPATRTRTRWPGYVGALLIGARGRPARPSRCAGSSCSRAIAGSPTRATGSRAARRGALGRPVRRHRSSSCAWSTRSSCPIVAVPRRDLHRRRDHAVRRALRRSRHPGAVRMTDSRIAARPAEPFADVKARAADAVEAARDEILDLVAPHPRQPGARLRGASRPPRGSPRPSAATGTRSSTRSAASRRRSAAGSPAAWGRTGRGSGSSPSTTRCPASATAAATTRWRRRAWARRSRSPASATRSRARSCSSGTPAEERGSGKAIMIRDGLFEGLDAALLYHPCDRNHVEIAPLASEDVHGRRSTGSQSHAVVGPVEGPERARRDDRAVRVGGPVAPAAAARTAASTGSSRRAAPPRTSSRTGPGPGS